MNSKKNIYGVFLILVFVAVLVTITPVKKLVNKVLTDLSGSGTDSNKTITATFEYLDADGKPHNYDDELYLFITGNNNDRITLTIKANGKEVTTDKIYDQNASGEHQLSNGTYTVQVAKMKPDRGEKNVDEKTKYEPNDHQELTNGDIYNGSYVVDIKTDLDLQDKDEGYINISIKSKEGTKYTVSDILSEVQTATKFGIFTRTIEVNANLECGIGVENVRKLGNNFGLSEAGRKYLNSSGEFSTITVNKTYVKNGDTPVAGEKVVINLTKEDSVNETQSGECITDKDGKCSVTFTNVEEGTYSISEQIDGQDITGSTTITDSQGNEIEVIFSDNVQKFNVSDVFNYSYIEKADNNTTAELYKMRGPGILALGSQELYDYYLNSHIEHQETNAHDVTVVLEEEGSANRIDFDKEFKNLNELNVKLASAIDSSDVKVYYLTSDDLKSKGIKFKTEGKAYILVNVDCTGKETFDMEGEHYRDELNLNSENSYTNEDSVKIVYNFYTKDESGVIHPYDKKIELKSTTTGILLAPSAHIRGAVGNHGGTIIALEYTHWSGEVHQKVTGYVGNFDITNNKKMKDLNVQIEKVDSNGKNIVGAKMQLLSSDGKTVLDEWTTNNSAHIVSDKVEAGKNYIVKEVEVPKGYQKASDYTFKVENISEIQLFTIVDTQIKVSKYDTKGNLLSGAKLRIEDENGKIIEEWTTTTKEYIVQSQLEVGKKYTLKEVEAPKGYEVALDATFVVKNDNQDLELVMTDESEKTTIPENPDTPVSRIIKILKIDENNNFVSDAKLEILNSDGNVVEQWTSSEKAHEVDAELKVGETYTLHEVSAPKGYEKAKDVEFQVQDTQEVQEVKMIDKRIKRVAGVVETYDKITKAISMFFISVVFIVLGVVTYMKLNKKKFSK